MSVEMLIKEYQQLSEADRMRFLELIHPNDESKDDLTREWKSEINKRMEAYEEGQTEAIDGKEMEQQLIKKHGIKL